MRGQNWTPVKFSENCKFRCCFNWLWLSWGGVKVRRRFTLGADHLDAVADRGYFVRTFWRTDIDELSRKEPALEVFLPEKGGRPASFQGESVPAGVLTPSAQLLVPLPPVSVDQLMPDAVPDAWKEGQATAYALSVALSAKVGRPLPWTVARRAIDDALKARWIEMASESLAWPCDMAGAAKASLRVPKARGFEEPKPGEQTPHPKGARYAEATLEPPVLHDLVDVLPDVLKAAAGIPLSFHVRISIADNPNLTPTTIDTISRLLEEVSSDLRLKT